MKRPTLWLFLGVTTFVTIKILKREQSLFNLFSWLLFLPFGPFRSWLDQLVFQLKTSPKKAPLSLSNCPLFGTNKKISGFFCEGLKIENCAKWAGEKIARAKCETGVRPKFGNCVAVFSAPHPFIRMICGPDRSRDFHACTLGEIPVLLF